MTDTDGLLDVATLVRMFEESESTTTSARGQSERDRDYYDGIQYTAAEIAILNERGQPPIIDNRIKTKIDYLVGLEKQQRIDPRALPRTPAHEDDANAASQVLKYVADTEEYDNKRSGVWKNLLIEGSGGISVSVVQGYNGKPQVKLRRWAWDRMFYDPHSSEPDFSDAGYWGGVVWMDYSDALAMYPDAQEALESTLNHGGDHSETYDDKPKTHLWADRKRKRVRVCQIEIKRDGKYYFAEFTKGGILKAGPSPYVDDTGESDGEMVFQSAYVNRENERYGLVREMISLQDAINKRGSKALHLLNTSQVVLEDGAVNDIEKARKEAAKPNGVIVVNPGYSDKFTFNTRADLAQSHFELLQDAKNSIDLKGPNATMMGDKAQGASSASGRAIIASQQGGMVQLGDLLDHLRHFDKRVFTKIWNRIRQFYTAEEWIRITDDERNVKWVGMNVDPARLQMAMQQDPSIQEKIAGTVGSVAELDCDIIIDAVPDAVTPALEQWQGLVELAKAGIPIPPQTLIKAAPNIKDKGDLLQEMEQAQQQQAQQPDPETAKAQAMLQIEQAKAEQAAQLQQQKAQIDAQAAQEKAQIDAAVAMQRAQAEMQLKRETAEAEIALERMKAMAQIEIDRMKAEAVVQLNHDRAQQAEGARVS